MSEFFLRGATLVFVGAEDKKCDALPEMINLFDANTGAEFVIGRIRTQCHVSMESSELPPFISGQHAKFVFDEGQNTWTVQDLGSTNGVYINKIRIEEQANLKHGDKISFGPPVNQQGEAIGEGTGGYLYEFRIPRSTRQDVSTPNLARNTTLQYCSGVPCNAVEQDRRLRLQQLLDYAYRLAESEGKKEKSMERFNLSESGVEDLLWTEEVHLKDLDGVEVMVEDYPESECTASDGTSSAGQTVWIRIPRKEAQQLPSLQEPEDEEGKKWLVNPRQDMEDGEPRGVRQLQGEETPASVKGYIDRLREWKQANRLKKLCNGLYDLHIRGELESMEFTAGIGLLRGPFHKEGSESIECAFPVLEFSVKVRELPGWFEVYPADEELSVSSKVFDLFGEKTARLVRDVVQKSSDNLPSVCYDPGRHGNLLRDIAQLLKVQLWDRDERRSDSTGDDSKRRLHVEQMWTLHRAPKAQHSNAVAKDACGLREKLKSAGPAVVPEFCFALTHPDDFQINNTANHSRSSLSGPSEASLEGLEQEVLFPFQFNDEQQEVMELCKTHPLVVVDGPPGTGKTQTIANIACNLLAHGKRVLVTSHGAPALEVIKDKMRQALQGTDNFADAILLWNGTKRDAHHQLSKALVFYESCSKGDAKSKALDTNILATERAGRKKIGEHISHIDKCLELWSRWMIDPLDKTLCDRELEKIATSFEECMGTTGVLTTFQNLQSQQGILRELLSERSKDLLDLDGPALAARISKNGVQTAQEELCLDDESLPRATKKLVEFLKTGVSANLKGLESKLHEAKKVIRPVLALMKKSGRQPEDVAVFKQVVQSPCKGKTLRDQDGPIRKGLVDLRAVLLFLRSMPEVQLEDLGTVWSYDASTVIENCNAIHLSPVRISAAELPQITDKVMHQLRECVDSHCALSDSLRKAIQDLKVRDSEGNENAPQTAEHWRSVEEYVVQQEALNRKILKLPTVLREHLERSSNLAQSISEVTLLADLVGKLVDKFETAHLSQKNLQFVVNLPKSKFETFWRVDNANAVDAIMQSDAVQMKEAHSAIEKLRATDSSFSEACRFEVQWCGQTLLALEKVDIADLLQTATAELDKQTKGGSFTTRAIQKISSLFSSSSAGNTTFFDSLTINHKSISNAEDWKRSLIWLNSIDVLQNVKRIYHDKVDFLAGPAALLKAHQIVSDLLHPLFSQLSDDPSFQATFSACVLPGTRQRMLSADGLRELEAIRTLAQLALDFIPTEGDLLSMLFDLPAGDREQVVAAGSDLEEMQDLCCPGSSVSSSADLSQLGRQTRDLQDLIQWAGLRSGSECAALSADQILNSIDVPGYGAAESEYWEAINKWLGAAAFLMEKGARTGFGQGEGTLFSIKDLATSLENRFMNCKWREQDAESSELPGLLKKALTINRDPQKLSAGLIDDVKSVFLRVRDECICSDCRSQNSFKCIEFRRAAVEHAADALCQSDIPALADMDPVRPWEEILSSFDHAAKAFDEADELLPRIRRDAGLERWAEKLHDSLTSFGHPLQCLKDFEASLVDLCCKQFLRSISMARPNAQQMHEWLHRRNELDRQDKKHIRQILQVCIRNSIASRYSKGAVGKLRSVLDLSTWLEKKKNKGKSDYEQKRSHLNNLWQDTTIIDTMPIWLMSTDQVSKNLPCAFSCFDVVILDEASQSSILAFPALLRGKRVIVVGDDQQVAPSGNPNDYADLTGFLRQCDFDTQMELNLGPGKSIFDLFKSTSAAARVTLREHYRCLPQIIGFSKELFYPAMIPLRRDYARERPVELVFVKDGQRNSNTQTNMREAEEIVQMVRTIVTETGRSKEDNKPFSIGIISLWGVKQAKKIETLIDQDPELCAKKTEHSILCGDASKFQGAERDIVLISLVADSRSRTVEADNTSLTDLGPHTNVAASRGKDKLYIFHSFSPHNSKFSEEDWRRKLLTHYHNNQDWWHTVPHESPFFSVISKLSKVRIVTIYSCPPVTVEIAEVFCAARGPLAFVLHKQQQLMEVAIETWKQEFKCSCILTRVGWTVSWLWESDAKLWPKHTTQKLNELIQTLATKSEKSELKPRKSMKEEPAQEPEAPIEDVRDEPPVLGAGRQPQMALATTGASALGQGGGEASDRGGATKRAAGALPRAAAAEDYVLTAADVSAVLNKACDLPKLRSILSSIKDKDKALAADIEGEIDIKANLTKPELLARMVELRVKDSEGVAGLVEWLFAKQLVTKKELVTAAGELGLKKARKALQGLTATNKRARKSDGATCPSEDGEKEKGGGDEDEEDAGDEDREGDGEDGGGGHGEVEGAEGQGGGGDDVGRAEKGSTEEEPAQEPEAPIEDVRDEPPVLGAGRQPQMALALTGALALGQGGGEASDRGGATKRAAGALPRAAAAEDYVLTAADVSAVLNKACDLPKLRSILSSIKDKDKALAADIEGEIDIKANLTKPELLARMVELRVKDSEGVAGLVELMFVKQLVTKKELVTAAGELGLKKARKALQGLTATNKRARKSDGATCPSEDGEKEKGGGDEDEEDAGDEDREGDGEDGGGGHGEVEGAEGQGGGGDDVGRAEKGSTEEEPAQEPEAPIEDVRDEPPVLGAGRQPQMALALTGALALGQGGGEASDRGGATKRAAGALPRAAAAEDYVLTAADVSAVLNKACDLPKLRSILSSIKDKDKALAADIEGEIDIKANLTKPELLARMVELRVKDSEGVAGLVELMFVKQLVTKKELVTAAGELGLKKARKALQGLTATNKRARKSDGATCPSEDGEKEKGGGDEDEQDAGDGDREGDGEDGGGGHGEVEGAEGQGGGGDDVGRAEKGSTEEEPAQEPEAPIEDVRDEPPVLGAGRQPQMALALTGASALGQGGGEASDRGGATKRAAGALPRAAAAEDYVLTAADVSAVLNKACDLPKLRSILSSIKDKDKALAADIEGEIDIKANLTKPELLTRMVELRVKDSEGVAGLVEWLFVKQLVTKKELVTAAGELGLKKARKALQGLTATNKRARKSDGATCPSEDGEKEKGGGDEDEEDAGDEDREGDGEDGGGGHGEVEGAEGQGGGGDDVGRAEKGSTEEEPAQEPEAPIEDVRDEPPVLGAGRQPQMALALTGALALGQGGGEASDRGGATKRAAGALPRAAAAEDYVLTAADVSAVLNKACDLPKLRSILSSIKDKDKALAADIEGEIDIKANLTKPELLARMVELRVKDSEGVAGLVELMFVKQLVTKKELVTAAGELGLKKARKALQGLTATNKRARKSDGATCPSEDGEKEKGGGDEDEQDAGDGDREGDGEDGGGGHGEVEGAEGQGGGGDDVGRAEKGSTEEEPAQEPEAPIEDVRDEPPVLGAGRQPQMALATTGASALGQGGGEASDRGGATKRAAGALPRAAAAEDYVLTAADVSAVLNKACDLPKLRSILSSIKDKDKALAADIEGEIDIKANLTKPELLTRMVELRVKDSEGVAGLVEWLFVKQLVTKKELVTAAGELGLKKARKALQGLTATNKRARKSDGATCPSEDGEKEKGGGDEDEEDAGDGDREGDGEDGGGGHGEVEGAEGQGGGGDDVGRAEKGSTEEEPAQEPEAPIEDVRDEPPVLGAGRQPQMALATTGASALGQGGGEASDRGGATKRAAGALPRAAAAEDYVLTAADVSAVLNKACDLPKLRSILSSIKDKDKALAADIEGEIDIKANLTKPELLTRMVELRVKDSEGVAGLVEWLFVKQLVTKKELVTAAGELGLKKARKALQGLTATNKRARKSDGATCPSEDGEKEKGGGDEDEEDAGDGDREGDGEDGGGGHGEVEGAEGQGGGGDDVGRAEKGSTEEEPAQEPEAPIEDVRDEPPVLGAGRQPQMALATTGASALGQGGGEASDRGGATKRAAGALPRAAAAEDYVLTAADVSAVLNKACDLPKLRSILSSIKDKDKALAADIEGEIDIKANLTKPELLARMVELRVKDSEGVAGLVEWLFAKKLVTKKKLVKAAGELRLTKVKRALQGRMMTGNKRARKSDGATCPSEDGEKEEDGGDEDEEDAGDGGAGAGGGGRGGGWLGQEGGDEDGGASGEGGGRLGGFAEEEATESESET